MMSSNHKNKKGLNHSSFQKTTKPPTKQTTTPVKEVEFIKRGDDEKESESEHDNVTTNQETDDGGHHDEHEREIESINEQLDPVIQTAQSKPNSKPPSRHSTPIVQEKVIITSTRSNVVYTPTRPTMNENGDPVVTPTTPGPKELELEILSGIKTIANEDTPMDTFEEKLGIGHSHPKKLISKSCKRMIVSSIKVLSVCVLFGCLIYFGLSLTRTPKVSYEQILTQIKTDAVIVNHEVLSNIEKLDNQQLSNFIHTLYEPVVHNSQIYLSIPYELHEFLEVTMHQRWADFHDLMSKDLETLKLRLSMNSKEEVDKYYQYYYKLVNDALQKVHDFSVPSQKFKVMSSNHTHIPLLPMTRHDL